MNDDKTKIEKLVMRHIDITRELWKLQEAARDNKRQLVALLMDDHAIDCLDVNFTRVSRMYNTLNPKYNK